MSNNPITGDRIMSKLGDAEAQRKFDENFDRIFGSNGQCKKCGGTINNGKCDACGDDARKE